MTDENEISELPVLFGPRNGKSLFRIYPELSSEPVFKGIPPDELLWAWYIGIPRSPVDHDWPDNTRWRSAAAKCFPNNQDKRTKFGGNDVSEEVKAAVKKFSTYSPEARAAAKKIVQTIFHNFLKMADVDVDKDFLYTHEVGSGDNKTFVTEIDWTARKQYIDSSVTMSKNLPDLLKQVEEGFGIQENGKKEETAGGRAIDRYHQQKKEKK